MRVVHNVSTFDPMRYTVVSATPDVRADIWKPSASCADALRVPPIDKAAIDMDMKMFFIVKICYY